MTGGSGQLRVGIDGFNLAMRRGTGVATYARALSHCVAELGHQVDVLYGMNFSSGTPAALREIIFFDSLDQERRRPAAWPAWVREFVQGPFGHNAVEIPITGRVISRSFSARLPRFDRLLNIRDLFPMATRFFKRYRRFLPIRIANGPDIMHWTYPLPITLVGATNIYTVHDVVPLRLPYTTLDNKRHHFRLLAGCLEYGARICTVSEASRRDILSFFPQAEGRITNTYESVAIPTAFAAEAAGEDVLGLFGLGHRQYFLFFGSIEPKKNVGRIIEAYMTSGVRTPLVIIGAQAWKSENELRLLKDAGSALGDGRIRQFDYLPEALLLSLIRSARAVLFPSLYEGFGLPVLEAMALGTPVLTSREGSLPEVAGDAAVFADAYDVHDIAAGYSGWIATRICGAGWRRAGANRRRCSLWRSIASGWGRCTRRCDRIEKYCNWVTGRTARKRVLFLKKRTKKLFSSRYARATPWHCLNSSATQH